MALVVRAPACKHMLRRLEAVRQLEHMGAAVRKPMPKELGATWLSEGGRVLASLTCNDKAASLSLRDLATGTTLRLDVPESQGNTVRVWPADDSSAVLVEHSGPGQRLFWWRACQPADMQPLGNAAAQVKRTFAGLRHTVLSHSVRECFAMLDAQV